MPSFLSKVFGRKKDDKESPRRVEDTGLLDGKFEAVSPSATKFPEVANERQPRYREKDSPFNVFRSKSRPSSPEPKDKRAQVPHLSLNLPDLKNEEASRELGVVFEADLDSQLLPEETIGSRRLNPLEALILVRACSEAIIARGLETLGVMHPHWYSASPEEQKKLISLFLKSLNPIATLSPTPSAFATAFDSEISSTQSPYDVAAVLRWGLRHLQLDGTSFGKDSEWYKTFFDAERSAGYPPNGYSSTLAPLLPASHLELLTATLELLSSLAAHAEANGISGSKLSKFFGLWLLAVERARDDDDWSTFYARWERTGRMLEHLFLARIRDDATASRMPTRLLELVQRYPYQTVPNADLLARPRFSTIQYDALFVRIETELPSTVQPSHHPLRILSEAFKADGSLENCELAALWESIRKAGAQGGSSSPDEYPGLSHVFADETLRFLSLVPVGKATNAIGSTSFNLYTRPSSSDKEVTGTAATSSSVLKHSKSLASPIASSNVNSPVGPDWITFSTSGFLDDSAERPPLASTLMEKEKDMEVTIPRPSSPRLSLFNGRKSSDRPRTPVKAEEPKPSSSAILSPVNTFSKSTHVSLVQLDEAFVDFWSDAFLDPIFSSWPAFIICKLKNTETEVDGKRIEWLVLEQAFKRPPLPPVEASASSHSHESSRETNTSSPTSNKSDASLIFGSMFKRFGLFTSPRKMTTPLPGDKEGAKVKRNGKEIVEPKIGEMGEILHEERERKDKGKDVEMKKDEIVRVRVPSPKPKKSVDTSRQSVDGVMKNAEGSRTNGVVVGSLAAGAAAVVSGAAVAVTGASDQPEVAKAEEPVSAPAVLPSMNGARADNTASGVLPQGEVLASEPVKESIPVEETIERSSPTQNDQVPTSVATAAEPKPLLENESVQSRAAGRAPIEVSESEVIQHAPEKTKATDQEVVLVEETQSIEHLAEPAVEGFKVSETKVIPTVEDAKVGGHEAAHVVEEAKLKEPGVVPIAAEPKAVLSQTAPVVEEVKVLEPEAVAAGEELKAVDHRLEVAPAVEEARTLEPAIAPVMDEIKLPESKAALLAVEDTKVPQSAVEENKVPEPKSTCVFIEDSKVSESIVEENEVPELQVARVVVKDTKVSQPDIEENKVPAPIVDETNTSASVIEEAKIRESEIASTMSIEKVPAVVLDTEGKSASVVESVAEGPVKAAVEKEMPLVAAGVVTATVTEVVVPSSKEIAEESATVGPVFENDLHQAAAEVVSVVEKPVGPALEVAPELVSRMPVAKEESVSIEPEIIKEETSPDGAIEILRLSQQEPVIKETVAPGPSIGKSPDVGPARELVTEPAGGEHGSAAREPVATDNVPVIEPEEVAPPVAVEKVIAVESAPVTESPVLVGGEAVHTPEHCSSAAEGSVAEPSAPTEAKSISCTSASSAENSTAVIKPGNADAEEIAPDIEELAAKSEDIVEPTEQVSASPKPEADAVTRSTEEHTVAGAEAEHKPEVEIHAPVGSVSTDAPREIGVPVLQSSAGVHISAEEIATAEETTAGAKVVDVAVPTETQSVTNTAEQRSGVVDIKEDQRIDSGSTPSTSEQEIIPSAKERTASAAVSSEPEVKLFESEPPSIAVSPTEEIGPVIVTEDVSAVAEPVPPPAHKATENIETVELKEETLSPVREEAASLSDQSTFPATEPQVRVAATEVESLQQGADTLKDTLEDTHAPTKEVADFGKKPELEVQAPTALNEAEVVLVTTGHRVEENAEIVNTALTTEVVPAQSEVKSTVDEVQPTLVATDASSGDTMVTSDRTEKTPLLVREAPVAENPVPASVVEPEPKPVQTKPSSTAADQPVEEKIVVGNSIDTPTPIEEVPIVEEPTPSAVTELRHGLEVLTPVEADPTSTVHGPVHGPLEKSPNDIIEPTTISTEEKVITPNVEVLAPSAVVESVPVSTTVEVESASIAADQRAECTVGASLTGQTPIEEVASVVECVQPQPEVHALVKSEPTVVDGLNDTPASHAAEEVTVPVTKELVEEQAPPAAEPKPQAQVPAHTDTEPTQAVVGEDVAITDSKEEVPPLEVEKSVSAVEEFASTATEHEAENTQVPRHVQLEPALSIPDELVEEKPAVVVESTKATLVPVAEAVTDEPAEEKLAFVVESDKGSLAPATEAVAEPISRAEHEPVAPVLAPGDGFIKKSSFVQIEPTETPIPAPTAEDAKSSATDSEPEVEICVPVEPAPTVGKEHVEKINPITEHAPTVEVSVEEVPVIKKDTEATIVEEKPTAVKVTSVAEDLTESPGSAEETAHGVTLKDDAIMITDNGSDHSAAVKTTVAVDVHDNNAMELAKE